MQEILLAVVETDLRLLAAEAKKAESMMGNLMGMLHHSELPALRDATDRAARKVKEVEERQTGLSGVQQALEILTPFVRACETKYPKLACIGLSAFQKLLANDAVSIQGRLEIIRAFQAAEKLNDENVKLRILQASLTIIQSSSFADEQDGVQQLLSVIFRLYVTNKANQAVQSTAAATIRQAVALVFDHSVMRPTRTTMSASFSPVLGSPSTSLSPIAASASTPVNRSSGGYAALTSSSAAGTPLAGGGASGVSGGGSAGGGFAGPAVGREAVPVLLLEEIMGWLGEDKEVGWIQLPPKAPRPDDTFLYEMLEGVLLQRAGAIHRLPGLARVVRHKVAPLLVVRLDRACRKGVDENLAGDCRLVVRCAAALVRRHHDLAPEAVAVLVARLAETAGSVAAAGRGAGGGGGGGGGVSSRWQRFMALQALRPLVSDPYLLYRMYHLPAPQLAGDKPGSSGGLGSAPNSQRSLALALALSSPSPSPTPSEPSGAAGADAAGAGSGGPLPVVIRCLQEALMWYVRTASDSPEDDVVGALGNLYLQRAMGARDAVQETEAFGVHLAQGSEVVIAHLGLECVLGAVAATEALADVVVVPAEPGMPSPKLVMRDTPDVRCAAVAGLVRLLWPAGLAVTDTLLRAARHDVLVQLLVRALQTMTYCAGALGEARARDCLLARLCTHALLPPGEEDMGAMVAAATGVGVAPLPGAGAAGAGGDDRSGSTRRTSSVAAPAATPASFTAAPLPPGFLTAILNDRGGGISAGGPSAASGPPLRVVLTPRNIAALRSLFNLAHRLADALGSSGWLYVVDAVNALDRILASPHTTTAAYLMEMEGEMAMGLQPAFTGVGVPGGGGPGAGGASGPGGGGMTPMPSAAPGGVVPLPSAAAAALAGPDGDDEDGATSAQRELRILSSAADQLFENTHHMSPEAVVSLLGALSEISHRTLAGMGLLAATAGVGATAGGAAGAGTVQGGLPTGGGLLPAASGLSGMLSTGGAGAASATSLGSGASGASGTAGGAAASAGGVLGAAGGAGGVAGVAGLTGGGAVPLVVQPVVGPGGLLAPPGPGPVRLCALNRMVDTLLHNLWRVQDLWGIFLAHVLEALGSGNAQVRTAALDALDRTITGALNPDLQHVPDKFTAPLPMPEDSLTPFGTLGIADSMLAAGRRGLSFMTPSLPSFAMSLAAQQAALQLPGSVGPSSPGPGQGPGGMVSRRMSRDVPQWAGSSTGGAGGPATSTLTVSLQQLQLQQQQLTPGSGSQPPSLRPSLDAGGRPPMPPQLASPSPPVPLPGGGTGSTPFASSLGNAAVAAGPGSPGAGFGVGGFMSTAAASPPSFTLMAPGALAAAPTATLTTITATATCAAATTSAAAATAAAVRGVQQAAQSEDVQHMLLVALDSLYREGGRSADVRRGLLRIALHVLQHHGDGLTRGWVPLMRLLEAVPRAGQDPQEVRLGFQVVELLATDYLASSLPKEHVAKALDVVAKFAQQDVVLNVSLTAITMLWNVSDHLARSRGTLSKGRAAQHLNRVQSAAAAAAAASAASAAAASAAGANGAGAGTPQPGASSAPVAITASGTSYNLFSASAGAADAAASTEKPMSPAFAAALNFARGVPSRPATSSPGGSVSAPGPDQPQPQQPPATAASTSTAAAVPGGAAGPQGGSRVGTGGAVTTAAAGAPAGGYPLHDLNEEESIAMLMIAFRSLKSLSVDPRPEARNAAVRTLFLAVCSHGGKFPRATWHELFWQLLFELLTTIHRVSATSSREEAAAVELGKERGGRSVVMLVHHSRNSEQKQWDETLVLALAGAGKVLRSYLPLLSGLDVWGRAWEELMQILGDVLASGRKGVSMAATSLLTTIMQAHGTGPLVTRTMWRQSLGAIDRGVTTMAAPNTSAPLQARAELLACISTLASLLLLRTKPAPAGASAPGSALDTFASAASSASGGTDLPGPGSSFLHSGGPGASLSAGAGATGTAGTCLPPAEPEHLLMFVGWLDRFARYPVGAEDSSAIHFTTIGPIQKAVLGALAALPPAVTAAGAWPEVLGVLCHMLRPFNTLALRQYSMQQAAVQQACAAAQRRAAAAAAAGAPLDSFASATSAASASTAPGSRDVSAHAGSIHGAGAGPGSGPGVERAAPVIPAADDALEARAMSPQWMAKVAEMLATWYRDQVSWQVRVATFPLLVAALSECMACRHLQAQQQLLMIQQQQQAAASAASAGSGSGSSLVLGGSVVLTMDAGEPLDELWRAAARGFVTVVQTGLPSINICSQAAGASASSAHQQVPQSTWPALARAFQMFFLATSLPPLQQPPADAAASIAVAAAAAAAANIGRGGSAFSSITSDAGGLPQALAQPSAEQVAADAEITAAVLDCLSDTVLSSCQHAPVEVRRALVEVLDAGASSLAAPAAAGISAAAMAAAAAAPPPSPSDAAIGGLPGRGGGGAYDESGLTPGSRFSHVCLAKLYVLCSRGQEQPEAEGRELPGVRSQMEVAQLALPVFVSRCESILLDYTHAEQRARSAADAATAPANADAAGSQPPASPRHGHHHSGQHGHGHGHVAAALHDKAVHVIELLQQLTVVPAVSDALLSSRPHLRFWLDVGRAVRMQGALPPAPAAAAAAAAAAAPATSRVGSGAGVQPAPIAAGMLTPPALSRRSSSGTDALSGLPGAAGGGSVAGGSVAGDAVQPSGPSNGGLTGRASTSSQGSFFSRTYSSTGALLSSAMAAAAGTGGAAPAVAGVSHANGGLGAGRLGTDGSGGGAQTPVAAQRSAVMSGGASGGPLAVPPAAAGPVVLTGKLQWAKEQPQVAALYGVLVECIGSSDPVIRACVQGMLAGLGGGLGLCAAPIVPRLATGLR